MTEPKPLCVIAGAGPGNGQALSDKFRREGYRVVLLARDLNRLQAMAGGNPDVVAMACDMADPDSIESTLSDILRAQGVPAVFIHNAGSGLFGAPLQASLEDFESAWRINALGLLCASQLLAPAMVENGGGSILVTGATASLRGGANFAAFASAKAAQRNLAQSLARSLGPQGVHVALALSAMTSRRASGCSQSRWSVAASIFGSVSVPAIINSFMSDATVSSSMGPAPRSAPR